MTNVSLDVEDNADEERTSGQARDLVVLRNVTIQSDIFQMLANNVCRRVTLTGTFP